MTDRVAVNPNVGQIPPSESPKELPFVVKAVGHLTLSSIFGYVQYYLVKTFFDKEATAKPFVLRGLCFAGIQLGMELTYKAAVKVLGDRSKYENYIPQSTLDKFRKHSWKVIKTCEDLSDRIDSVFSKKLKIRTVKEIESQKIQDVDLRFFEIFRRSIQNQCKETVYQTVPLYLSTSIITKAGYLLPGAQLLWGWEILGFVLGVINGVSEVYNKKLLAEQEKMAKELQTGAL